MFKGLSQIAEEFTSHKPALISCSGEDEMISIGLHHTCDSTVVWDVAYKTSSSHESFIGQHGPRSRQQSPHASSLRWCHYPDLPYWIRAINLLTILILRALSNACPGTAGLQQSHVLFVWWGHHTITLKHSKLKSFPIKHMTCSSKMKLCHPPLRHTKQFTERLGTQKWWSSKNCHFQSNPK